MRKIVFLATIIPTLCVMSATAAFANDYLNETVQGLQSANVYVSPGADTVTQSGINAIQSQVQGTSIAVVVLPASAKGQAGDVPTFVDQVSSATSYQTVVVVIGNDLQAVSAINPLASSIAESAESDNTSVVDAVSQFVSEVQVRSDDTPSSPIDTEGSDIIVIAAWILAPILIASMVVPALRQRRKRRSTVVATSDVFDDVGRLLHEFGSQVNKVTDVETQAHLRTVHKRISNHIQAICPLSDVSHQNASDAQEIARNYAGMLRILVAALPNYLFVELYQGTLSNGEKIAAEYQRSFAGYPARVEFYAKQKVAIDLTPMFEDLARIDQENAKSLPYEQ